MRIRKIATVVILGTGTLALLLYGLTLGTRWAAAAPERQLLTLLHLGMSREEVRATVGLPGRKDIHAQQGFPWAESFKLRVLRGRSERHFAVDEYLRGWEFYWLFYDDHYRLVGIARAST